MTIYIAVYRGMVGSTVWRYFESHVSEAELIGRSSKEFDLCLQSDVAEFISPERPDLINVTGVC
jgi:dTDP-4-dehydrorhamnose reductase